MNNITFFKFIMLSYLVLLLSSCKKDNGKIDNPNIIINEQFSFAAHQKGGDLIKTDNGGYLLFGATSTDGEYYDLYVIETDENGKEKWHAVYGETSISSGTDIRYIDEQAVRVVELPSGEYVLVCNRTYHKEYSVSGVFVPEKTKIVLYKIGSTGGNISSIELDSEDDYSYSAADIELLDDGGFILVGNTTNINKNKPQYFAYKDYDKKDMLVTRLNSDFTKNWASGAASSQGRGFVGIDAATGVAVTKDGYYLVTGTVQEMDMVANEKLENNLIAMLYEPTQGGVVNQKTYGLGYELITNDMYFDQATGEAIVLGYEPIPNFKSGNLVVVKITTGGFNLEFPEPAELYGANGKAIQDEDGSTLTKPLIGNRIIKGLNTHKYAIGSTVYSHMNGEGEWLWFR
ncbi:MAG: hypothetical protein GY810_27790 [Aureispira sp.]|nr:hypothetical protein [Aureispira sp.]